MVWLVGIDIIAGSISVESLPHDLEAALSLENMIVSANPSSSPLRGRTSTGRT